MTRDTVGTLFAGVLAACAVVATALWVRREMIGPPEESRLRTVSNWQDFAVGGQQFGAEGAPVEVVVFSDFQCSFCSVLAKRLDSLGNRMGDTVSIRFRHFPMLNLHKQARAAAMAAECAGQQGKFKQYHDALFASQDSVGVVSWGRFATEAGVQDPARFDRCVIDSMTASRVAADVEAGIELHVQGTPSVLVNDVFHRGLPTLATLQSLVRKALRSHKRLTGRGSNAENPGVGVTSCSLLASDGPIPESLIALQRRFGPTQAALIRDHQVCLKMSPEMVRLAWGSPLSIVKRSSRGVERSEWKYASKTVILANGEVASIR